MRIGGGRRKRGWIPSPGKLGRRAPGNHPGGAPAPQTGTPTPWMTDRPLTVPLCSGSWNPSSGWGSPSSLWPDSVPRCRHGPGSGRRRSWARSHRWRWSPWMGAPWTPAKPRGGCRWSPSGPPGAGRADGSSLPSSASTRSGPGVMRWWSWPSPSTRGDPPWWRPMAGSGGTPFPWPWWIRSSGGPSAGSPVSPPPSSWTGRGGFDTPSWGCRDPGPSSGRSGGWWRSRRGRALSDPGRRAPPPATPPPSA